MQRSFVLRHIAKIIISVTVLLGVLATWWMKSLIPEQDPTPKKMVQQITLIAPPPPPPPTPPPEEPEVEEVKEDMVEEVPQDIPEPSNDEPAGQDLGLDADGAAGSDGFGLIGKKGGRGLGLGKVGSYETMVKERLIEHIYDEDNLRHLAYSGVVKLWIDSHGDVQRVAIELTSGSEDTKKRLVRLLEKMKFDNGPPIEMAGRSINLQITSQL